MKKEDIWLDLNINHEEKKRGNPPGMNLKINELNKMKVNHKNMHYPTGNMRNLETKWIKRHHSIVIEWWETEKCQLQKLQRHLDNSRSALQSMSFCIWQIKGSLRESQTGFWEVYTAHHFAWFGWPSVKTTHAQNISVEPNSINICWGKSILIKALPICLHLLNPAAFLDSTYHFCLSDFYCLLIFPLKWKKCDIHLK